MDQAQPQGVGQGLLGQRQMQAVAGAQPGALQPVAQLQQQVGQTRLGGLPA